MPMFMISALDIFIIMRSSINCSAVHPPYYLLSWEKPLVKPIAPGSIFHHISFRSTFFCNLLLSDLQTINTKNIYFTVYLSLLDLTFASSREGIDNPFIVLGACCLIVCAGIWWLVRCLILDWYLGSQNWGKYLPSLLHHPFLFKGKPTQTQEVAGRISGAVTGEICAKTRHTKYPS